MNKHKVLFELNKSYEKMSKDELIAELLYLQEIYLIGDEE